MIAIDIAVFVLLGAAAVAMRRIRPPAVQDLQEAFQDLDRSITKFVPDVPAGYTWGEAMERLKASGVKADWPKMESNLASYEAFRYGGREMPAGGEDEVVKLSMKIRRRIFGSRNKGKGTERD